MAERLRSYLLFFLGIASFFFFSATTYSQEGIRKQPVPPPKPILETAALCEEIRDFVPRNEAVIFSITIGEVHCYSSFDAIPEEMPIYHNWYFQDRLTARVKLTLKPPRWRTYSTLKLREADKGPWRVEITDLKGRIFRVLRFSITD